MENLKHFHEIIIGVINGCLSASQLSTIQEQLLLAEVPGNHDQILYAFSKKAKYLNFTVDKTLVEKFEKEKKSLSEKKSPKNLFPSPYLQSGSVGQAVVCLQVMLFLLGYNEKIIPDGDYGEETIAGVKTLQKKAEVEEDGHFGPETRKAFFNQTGLGIYDISKIKGKNTVYLNPGD